MVSGLSGSTATAPTPAEPEAGARGLHDSAASRISAPTRAAYEIAIFSMIAPTWPNGPEMEPSTHSDTTAYGCLSERAFHVASPVYGRATVACPSSSIAPAPLRIGYTRAYGKTKPKPGGMTAGVSKRQPLGAVPVPSGPGGHGPVGGPSGSIVSLPFEL